MGKFLSYISLTLLIVLSLFISVPLSSSEVLIRDGKEYGKIRGAFRNRWWNYYERGLSYLDGRFYKEAIRDFEKAIKQRPEDRRMARTYGMHFVDYFPNREMGLAYYLGGNFEEAKKYFDLSNSQQPSAKANYYLERILKQSLKKQGLSISSPELKVDLPKGIFWTKDTPITISGTATDNQYVSEIIISGKNYYMETSGQRVSFKEKLYLDQGRHDLEIIARNLMGGETRKKFIIYVDRQGPVISFEQYSPDAGTRDYIKGYLYDESGLISLKVNGAEFPIGDGQDVPFNIPVRFGAEKIVLIARDRLGNETNAKINIKALTASKKYPLLAYLDDSRVVSDSGFRITSLLGKKDENAPLINLSEWTEKQTVFIDRIYLEGEARDESEIVALSINGTPVLRKESPIIFFNHLVNLKKGQNIILVRAEDKKGHIAEKEILINREIPKVFQHESRLSLALFPFENKSAKESLAKMYGDMFFVKLMDQDRFRILEREKLDIILREQKLSSSDIVDRNTALELGRLMAAQTSLVGTIVESEIGIEVVARLIDNETSELLAEKDVYDEVEDRSSLATMAEGLAIKFYREFPLVDGMIVQKKGDVFFTDLGKEKIKPNRRLIIYRENEPVIHPVTGKKLGSDNEIIGYGRVTQVMDEMSKVKFIKGINGEIFKELDKVMPQ